MMRISLILLILFVAVGAHAASFSNDSDSIDIDYIPGPDSPQDGGGGSGGGGGGGGGSGGQSESGQGTGGNGQEGSSEVTVDVTVTSDSGSSGSGGNGDAGGEPSAGDVINTLLANQALGFSGSSGAGTGSGESVFGVVRISGEDVRAALRARGITGLSLRTLSNRFLTRGDFAIAAASSLLTNKAIEDVVMSAESFSLSYKAEGRLFAVFPMHYTVRLTINPRATTLPERVQVKLPWYRFFLQTFFSKQQLQQELDAIIVATLAEASVDERTRLFLAVTTAIQKRVDTVAGSL